MDMRLRKIGLVLGIVAMAGLAAACDNCKKDHVFGPAVPVGNGMAMAWAKLDKTTKKPIAVGITLTETAIQGLPMDMPGEMPTMEYRLELPAVIKGLPYEYILLNWNPKGHIPAKIYDVPHFDAHFFTI